jgi:arylformamidase
MKFYLKDGVYIDTSKPIDISIPIVSGASNLSAWHVDPPRFDSVRNNGFIGSVADGGSVNFRDIYFNPHGHGTHTECVGHITKEVFSVNQAIRTYFFNAFIVSVEPILITHPEDGKQDRVIFKEQIEKLLQGVDFVEALIIRTLPNMLDKRTLSYSGTNPPYFDADLVGLLDAYGIKHLLVDVPSVDREVDGGKLTFHHRFWMNSISLNHSRTITELVFIENTVSDGAYILELQIAPFENDAAPSRPILYEIRTSKKKEAV